MAPGHSSSRPVFVIAMASIAVCACVLPTCCTLPHRLFFNPSSSAPRGWYWLADTQSHELGTFTISNIPRSAAELADDRHYIPRTVPVLKQLAAAAGDSVCESAGNVAINGRPVARAVTQDGRGRDLSAWQGCRVLAPGEYFLLNQNSLQSFDSRYFGPVNESMLQGTAIPLWTW